jgi:hypothetical protein
VGKPPKEYRPRFRKRDVPPAVVTDSEHVGWLNRGRYRRWTRTTYNEHQRATGVGTEAPLLYSEVEKLDRLSPAGLPHLDFGKLLRRVEQEHYALVRSALAGEAERALQLFVIGQIGKLRKCGWCSKYYFGRRGKLFCRDACRAMYSKALHPDEEKRARRRRYCEKRRIPDCEQRIKRLEAEKNLNSRWADRVKLTRQIERWKGKLESYRQELKTSKKEEGK